MSSEFTHKRFFILSLGSILAVLLFSTVFNRVIDPYGLWDGPSLDGINIAKTKRDEHAYLFKARDLINLKPKTLLMGTSRAAFTLPATSNAILSAGLDPAYNGAIIGGNVTVLSQYIEYAVTHNENLEVVVWGLDFFTFGSSVKLSPTFRPKRLTTPHLTSADFADTHLSWQSLADSVTTVSDNLRDLTRQPYTAEGQLSPWDMQRSVAKLGMRKRFENSLHHYANSTTRYRDFAFNEAHWRQLLKTKALLQEHGIELKIYVSPVHVSLFELMHEREIWPDYLNWLQRLATEFDYWDYSVANDVTGEPLEDSAQYFWDASHLRASIGQQVLLDILSENQESSMGKRVSSINVDTHITNVNQAFMRWRQENPEARAFIRALIE